MASTELPISNSVGQRWYKQQRKLLKQGQIDIVLRNLQALLCQAKATTIDAIRTICDFFVSHQKHMHYKQLAEDRFFIGSGAMKA
ncbi:MAG: hypothetical protein JXB30_02925 [Anaerolineae bacterium]|nr:hypothetical protein [Anaerolineae bacterium]